MALTTYEGVVEQGKIRLTHRKQASEFKMKVSKT